MAVYISALKQDVQDLIKFQAKKFNPDEDEIINNEELPTLLNHYSTEKVSDLIQKPSLVDYVFPEVVNVEKTEDDNYIVKFSNGKEKKMTEKEIISYSSEKAPSYIGTAFKATMSFLGICCLTNPATASVALIGAGLLGVCGGSLAHDIWDSSRGQDMMKLK